MKAIFPFLLKYCRSENPAIRLAESILVYNSSSITEISLTWGLNRKKVKNESYILPLLPLKTITKAFQETQKNQPWDYFGPFLPH